MREINLDEWELFGKGGEGESYKSKTDPKLMLKLNFDFIDKAKIEYEFNINKYFIDNGVRTPKAYELVRCGKRYGILFERIVNKKSLNQLFKEEPEKIEENSKLLAIMLKQFHSLKSDKLFGDFASHFLDDIEHAKKMGWISEDRRVFLRSALDNCKRDHLVMLDPHPGNVIVADGSPYLIDLGAAANGDPMFDIGMWYAYSHNMIEAQDHFEVHHVGYDVHHKVWDFFLKEYFETEDREKLLAIEKEIKVYSYITMLWFRRILPSLIDPNTDFEEWLR